MIENAERCFICTEHFKDLVDTEFIVSYFYGVFQTEV